MQEVAYPEFTTESIECVVPRTFRRVLVGTHRIIFRGIYQYHCLSCSLLAGSFVRATCITFLEIVLDMAAFFVSKKKNFTGVQT